MLYILSSLQEANLFLCKQQGHDTDSYKSEFPCLSFLSLTTGSVGADAGEDGSCHAFAAIKTAPAKCPVTLSASHIVWISQIIALNASAANADP